MRDILNRIIILGCLVLSLGLLGAGRGLAHEDGPRSAKQTRDSFSGAADFDAKAAYEYSQAAIGRKVGDHFFRAVGSDGFSMSAYRGKPLILSFIYSSCFHTCPTLTRTLADAVEKARDAIGAESFNVLSVGFDTRKDSPEAMRYFGQRHGAGDGAWRFASSDAPSIEALAAETGFIYFASPKGFEHLTQTTLIDAEGKVFAQIYGQNFPMPRLVEQLKQMVFGTTANLSSMEFLINKVRLFCTIYDPHSDRYRFDYSVFIGMGLSAIVLILVGWFLASNIRRLWHEGRNDQGERGSTP